MTTAALGLTLALASVAGHPQAAMLAPAGPSATQAVSLGTVAETDATADARVRIMLSALNAERASRGLSALALDPKLSAVAANFATDMSSRHFFSHNSPDGTTPFTRMDRANIQYGYAGENIALDETPAAAAEELWNSPPHRENILDPHYAKVGVGVQNSSDGLVVVEDFSD